MLCQLRNVKQWFVRAGFLPLLFLSMSAIAWAPMAKAQTPDTEQTTGKISGTVLLRAGNRPASQVAVSLRSHAAGIFRRVLTDLEGHFEVRSLPPSTYEIVVDEPGYEPAQTDAQLDGAAPKLVLYLNSSSMPQSQRDSYSVSVRQLKIPGKARGEYEKGLASLAKSDLAVSVNHFTKATQAFPDFYEAYYHMGVAETNLGHKDEARQAFQKSIDLSGGRFAWAEFGFGYLLYQEGKAGEAEMAVRRGLELDRSSPNGYLLLGMAQLREDRVDEAERSAHEALLRNPNYAQAYLVLSDVYARRHEYRAQLQGLESYLKLDPNGPESEHVRKVREAVLKVLAKSHPED